MNIVDSVDVESKVQEKEVSNEGKVESKMKKDDDSCDDSASKEVGDLKNPSNGDNNKNDNDTNSTDEKIINDEELKSEKEEQKTDERGGEEKTPDQQTGEAEANNVKMNGNKSEEKSNTAEDDEKTDDIENNEDVEDKGDIELIDDKKDTGKEDTKLVSCDDENKEESGNDNDDEKIISKENMKESVHNEDADAEKSENEAKDEDEKDSRDDTKNNKKDPENEMEDDFDEEDDDQKEVTEDGDSDGIKSDVKEEEDSVNGVNSAGTDDDSNDEKEAKECLEENMDDEITPEFDNKYEGKTSQLPNFAVVYSFLNMFGALMGLPNITLPDLEASIDTTTKFGSSKVADESNLLEMLHLKLFRKLAKSTRMTGMGNVTPDRMKKALIKLCQYMNLPFSWDLEQFGYHILTSDQKLAILKALCEAQFDENPKFRNDLSDLYKVDPTVLRLPPFGSEQDGSNVWVHEDTECNIHVYAGEDDDPDGATWRLRVGCLDDMATYISKLKMQTEVNPKDVAAHKIKERRIAREEERQRKKAERDLRRKEEEEKRSKKKGRSTRRGRKKKEEDPPSPIPISETSEEEEDDGCARCYENKAADIVLLCDGCDAAYHTLCLRPPVIDIPDDDWFCPHCMQVKLVQKLELKYIEIKTKLKKKERKAKRMDFYGIRNDNIIDQAEGRRVGRAAAKRVDYNFAEYDDLISEAVSSYKSKRRDERPERVESREERMRRRGMGEGDDDTKSSEENGVHPDGEDEQMENTDGRRRAAATGIKKRKMNVMSSDEYDKESDDGSEYVASSEEEVRYKRNMRNFIVDDNEDVDEIEARYSRNKRLRRTGRSSRSRGTRRSSRKRSNRYEDDSNYSGSGGESDKSYEDNQPQRRQLRERKAENMRSIYMFDGYGSDDDIENEKEVDDGGEWGKDNEEEEEVAEEIESDEISSNSDSEKRREKAVTRSPPRELRTRPKKKRVVMCSDDDSDEEVPCIDDSEEEAEKEKKKKTNSRVRIDDSEEEEEEEEEEVDSEYEREQNRVESDEEEEETNENKKDGDDKNKEAEVDSGMRKIAEEEENAGIRLKDDNILKSSTLPPCFSSSLPPESSPAPNNSSEADKSATGSKKDQSKSITETVDQSNTNIFKMSENVTEKFNPEEFWKELKSSNQTDHKSDVNKESKNTINEDMLIGDLPPDVTLPSGNSLTDTVTTNGAANDMKKMINDILNENPAPQGIKSEHPGHNTLDHNNQQQTSEMGLHLPTSNFHNRPPPPYHAIDSPRGPPRMANSSFPPRGPLHPQHRLRAMAAAMQSTGQTPVYPPRQQSPGGPPPGLRQQSPQLHPSMSHGGARPPHRGLHPTQGGTLTGPQGAPLGPRYMQSPRSRLRSPLEPGHQQQRPVSLHRQHSPMDSRHPQPNIQVAANKLRPPVAVSSSSAPGSTQHRPTQPGQPPQQTLPGQQSQQTLPGQQSQHRQPGQPPQQTPPGHQPQPGQPPQPTQSGQNPRSSQPGQLPQHTQQEHHPQPNLPQNSQPGQPTRPGQPQHTLPGQPPRPSQPAHPSHQNQSSRPMHPSMRLPTHPSSRLRGPSPARPPTAVSSSHPPSTAMRMNYPYANTQPGMRIPPPNWHGGRPLYDAYYPQFNRPQGVPTTQFYGGQQPPSWPPNQQQHAPGWERLQQQAGPNGNHGNGNIDGKQTPQGIKPNNNSQSKEYKEHMKQLKEHAKQEKEMKKLQKLREKELKQQNKRPYSPKQQQTTPSSTPVGNMNYFKSMVIGGDNNSGGGSPEPSTHSPNSYPPFKSARM